MLLEFTTRKWSWELGAKRLSPPVLWVRFDEAFMLYSQSFLAFSNDYGIHVSSVFVYAFHHLYLELKWRVIGNCKLPLFLLFLQYHHFNAFFYLPGNLTYFSTQSLHNNRFGVNYNHTYTLRCSKHLYLYKVTSNRKLHHVFTHLNITVTLHSYQTFTRPLRKRQRNYHNCNYHFNLQSMLSDRPTPLLKTPINTNTTLLGTRSQNFSKYHHMYLHSS